MKRAKVLEVTCRRRLDPLDSKWTVRILRRYDSAGWHEQTYHVRPALFDRLMWAAELHLRVIAATINGDSVFVSYIPW
jgi:hypothetical protein